MFNYIGPLGRRCCEAEQMINPGCVRPRNARLALLSPKESLADSCADILARAPSKLVVVGTSYGGNLALEIALVAPDRISGLWRMGCDPGAPQTGGPDLAAGLEVPPDAVIDMLAGLVVRPVDTASALVFGAMERMVGAVAGAAQAISLARERIARRVWAS